MILLAVLCLLGLAAGFVLLIRVPVCGEGGDLSAGCSIVIPARNEADNLPRLLSSIPHGRQRIEVVVVDDHSTDATADIATQYGTRVVAAPALQQGWTGKTSACFNGALIAEGDPLLFVDADTWFEPKGLDRMLATFRALGPESTAYSIVPFHVTYKPYEELSLFFNLMMVFGAGGFGLLKGGKLFGQSLLIRRQLYMRSGTHAAVRGQILENLTLADQIEDAGGRCVCGGGRGVLHMQMFPEGLRALCEGWTKAFASGAAAADRAVLVVAVFWLSMLCTGFLWLVFGSGVSRTIAAGFYLTYVLQLAWFARQIGSFQWYTFALYPVPLFFFFGLFGRSLKKRMLRQQITWRARQL